MPSFRLTVNGTEREVALPTLSVQHIVNGPDILEGDIQDELGSEVLNMDDVVILYRTDVSPETVYFEGLLQTTGNETWAGWGFSRLRKITAFDYGVYTSFVTVTALSVSTGSPTDSLSSLLSTLVADYLTDYGVTLHPSQATGPTLDPNAWDGDYVEGVLNAISEQTGWVWKIDAQKRLRMFDPATEAAGFNVTATNDTYIEDIKTNILRQRYYNRIFIEGGNGYHTIIDEQHFGDGAKTTFEMNAPMHYFEVDYTSLLGFAVGLTLLVVRTGGTTVEYANDALTAQWTFNPAPDYSLTQVSGAVLGPTEYILIPGYAAQYPMRIVADGRGSPPAPARDLKLVRPTLFGRAALQSLADQILAASQTNFERISYLTDEVDILPGQTQTVNVAEAGVNDTYTAISVRLAYVSGGDTSAFRREVTAVNAVTARSFWLDLYRRWLMDNQGAGSSSTTLTPAGTSIPVGPGLPFYSAQFNKAGVFGGADEADGSVYLRPTQGGPLYGVENSEAVMAVEQKTENVVAQVWYNGNHGKASALSVYIDDGGVAYIEHEGSDFGFGLNIRDGDELSLAAGTNFRVVPGDTGAAYHSQFSGLNALAGLALGSILSTSTSYTIDSQGVAGTYVFDPTANATVTLPALTAHSVNPLTDLYRVLCIRNDSTQYVVTLDANSSELIYRGAVGRLTLPLMPGASVVLTARTGTGAGWKVLAYDLPPLEKTFTDTEVKALPTNASGLDLVPAPGSGFYIRWSEIELISKFSSGAYTNVNTTYSDLSVSTSTGGGYSTGPLNDNTTTPNVAALTKFMGASSRHVRVMPYMNSVAHSSGNDYVITSLANGDAGVDELTLFDNLAMKLWANNNGAGDFTGGHASNTLIARTHYSVEVVP